MTEAEIDEFTDDAFAELEEIRDRCKEALAAALRLTFLNSADPAGGCFSWLSRATLEWVTR